MAVYLINLMLIVGFGFLFIQVNPTETKKKIYCIICSIQWILISGLRDYSVGADTWTYHTAFYRVQSMPWRTVILNCWNYLFKGLKTKDPGYNLLQKIFQIFSDDYRMWLFFIAIVFTGLMARWIYRYSSMPDVSFVIYSILFYSFFAITGHRQTLATALIVFLGYELAKKRQFLKFAIVSFIAFMLHKSSLVFILYYVIAAINFTPICFVLIFASTVIIGVLGSRLYAPIALALGFGEDQIEYSVGGAGTYATVLLLLCFIAFCMYPWINQKRVDAKYLYNLLFLTMVSTVLVYHNQNFMRIQQYYSMVIMLIIPEIIRAFDKNYRVFAYLFVVIFLTVYLLRVQPQYRFFFM